MTEVIVKVVCASDGSSTPHDGRWVVAWNPHTAFGLLELTSTANRAAAQRFGGPHEVLREWKTISMRHPLRPDGKANRPLSGLTISLEAAE